MFILPPLPYAYDALEPAISAKTLKFHHDKHHKAYIEKTNKLVAEKGLTGRSLESVIKSTTGELFNNAAQAWNHAFYWESMTPDFKNAHGAVRRASRYLHQGRQETLWLRLGLDDRDRRRAYGCDHP